MADMSFTNITATKSITTVTILAWGLSSSSVFIYSSTSVSGTETVLRWLSVPLKSLLKSLVGEIQWISIEVHQVNSWMSDLGPGWCLRGWLLISICCHLFVSPLGNQSQGTRQLAIYSYGSWSFLFSWCLHTESRRQKSLKNVQGEKSTHKANSVAPSDRKQRQMEAVSLSVSCDDWFRCCIGTPHPWKTNSMDCMFYLDAHTSNNGVVNRSIVTINKEAFSKNIMFIDLYSMLNSYQAYQVLVVIFCHLISSILALRHM